MLKIKHRKYTKRIITILFLIHFSIIMNKEWTESNIITIEDENSDSKIKEVWERLGENLSRNNDGFDLTEKRVNLGIFDSQECLYDKTITKNILTTYGLADKPVDDNTRFILGQCNPVIFVPGLYSTRLMLTINCKKFAEKKENLINMRLFCGESLCKNGENENEEHVLWPALFDSPFELYVNGENKYSSCFGYFFKYHKPQECPKVHLGERRHFFYSENIEEEICLSDDAVKIRFYGGTEQTENRSECGLSAIKNIVSVGSRYLKESWVNSGAAKAFQNLYDRFYEMGYRPGFSIAGVPYDFRRFIATNELFQNVFKSQVERLYENTGKPVIVIGHSFGNLNVLSQIYQSDEKFLKKIKKFIAVAPPFAGSPKDLEIFLHGSKEFNKRFDIKNYDIFNVELNEFGQRLVLPLTPAGYELRPNPILFKLFNDNKYLKFKSAIEERLRLEKDCKVIDCSEEHIVANSKAFNELFIHFPSLHSPECAVTHLLNHEKYLRIMTEYSKNPLLQIPHFLPCRNDIYNTVSCPTIKIRLNETEDASLIESAHCHEKRIGEDESYLYNHSCEKTKNCLDLFFKKYHPYPYLDEKMIFLFERFYTKHSKDFPDVTLNITNYFDSKEKLKMKIEKMIDYHGDISKLKNLDNPKVDTIIIYSSFLPTETAFLFDEKKNLNSFDKLDVLMKGGDGTVPSWSSLLIGLKWLYEKKESKPELKNKIQLVEYCSTLSKKESSFGYNSTDPDREFIAISCECLDSDNFYNFKKTSEDRCDHGSLIGDYHLVKFIENYIKDDKNIDYESKDREPLNEDKLRAVTLYNKTENYEYKCNSILRSFVDK